MPHDVNGIELQAGDRVTLTGTVTAVHSDTGQCNCDIALDNGPDVGAYTPVVTMNANGLIKQIRHEPTAD